MAKKSVSDDINNQRSKLAEAARASILKKISLKSIDEYHGPLPAISSGSSCIDDLIGGTLSGDGTGPKCLGYPRRRITELYGAESSGKTTAALQAIAEAQKKGGLVMYLDFEHALDHSYASKIGVSFAKDKLLLYAPESMEQGWQCIYVGIQAGAELIVVDSVAAMVPAEDMLRKLDASARIGAVARQMSQNLPKIMNWLSKPLPHNPGGTALILINQIRANISTSAKGDPDTTAGGKAIKFYSYIRLKFTRIRSETVKRKDKMTGKDRTYPYGNHTQVKLIKSKVDGKQGFTTDIFIRFGQGIDDFYSVIEAAVNNRVVAKKGSFYEYLGERFQGREKFRNNLVSNPEVFSDLRSKVLASVRDEGDVKESDLEDDSSELLVELDDSPDYESDPEEVESAEIEADDSDDSSGDDNESEE